MGYISFVGYFILKLSQLKKVLFDLLLENKAARTFNQGLLSEIECYSVTEVWTRSVAVKRICHFATSYEHSKLTS